MCVSIGVHFRRILRMSYLPEDRKEMSFVLWKTKVQTNIWIRRQEWYQNTPENVDRALFSDPIDSLTCLLAKFHLATPVFLALYTMLKLATSLKALLNVIGYIQAFTCFGVLPCFEQYNLISSHETTSKTSTIIALCSIFH